MNPVNEGSEPVVFEGESERPVETSAQATMYSIEDSMAPSSVISEIHSQIFNRDPHGPRGLAEDSNRQSSHRRSEKRSENEPTEEKEEEKENKEEDSTTAERKEEKEKDQKEIDRSDYIVYSVNTKEPDYGHTSLPEPELDFIRENFNNFVIFESNGEITCDDTRNILNRLRALRHARKRAEKGGSSMNGGVTRHRDRHGSGAGGRSAMQDTVDRRTPGTRIRDTEASADGTNGPTNHRRHKRTPDVVFGGRDGVIYPSQFASRLQRNESEEDGMDNGEGSDSEASDYATPEELLRYMMFDPITMSSSSSQVPLDDYVVIHCPVSNKHAQNMIQILIIKCTTKNSSANPRAK